jgi:hypothetical protein
MSKRFAVTAQPRKGFQVLSRKGGVRMTHEVLQQLACKFPSAGEHIPKVPSWAPQFVKVDPAKLKKILQSSPKLKAPGWTGWSTDLLRGLAEDEVCWRGVTRIVADILSGRLSSPSARLLFCSSTLIAVPAKKTPRPIAMGCPFVKLASKFCFNLVLPAVQEIFSQVQFGVKVKGGSARAALLTRLLLDEDAGNRLVMLDAVNAFNTISRKEAVFQLYQHRELAPIFRIVHFLYSGKIFCLLPLRMVPCPQWCSGWRV